MLILKISYTVKPLILLNISKISKSDAKIQQIWILLQLVTIFIKICPKSTKKALFIINN